RAGGELSAVISSYQGERGVISSYQLLSIVIRVGGGLSAVISSYQDGREFISILQTADTAMQSTQTTSIHYTMHDSKESQILPISRATGCNFFPNQPTGHCSDPPHGQLKFDSHSLLEYNGNNGLYSSGMYEFGFPTSYGCYGSYMGSSPLTTDTEKEKEPEVRMVKGKQRKSGSPEPSTPACSCARSSAGSERGSIWRYLSVRSWPLHWDSHRHRCAMFIF
ncbi:unnamed protein product, partial [Oncorhynchus mykiss]